MEFVQTPMIPLNNGYYERRDIFYNSDTEDGVRLFEEILGDESNREKKVKDIIKIGLKNRIVFYLLLNPLGWMNPSKGFKSLYGFSFSQLQNMTIEELNQYRIASVVWDEYMRLYNFSFRKLLQSARSHK